jgi:hypothetical protein
MLRRFFIHFLTNESNLGSKIICLIDQLVLIQKSDCSLIQKSDGLLFKKACLLNWKSYALLIWKSMTSFIWMKKHDLSYLNEKAHLLIAISVNIIFFFAYNFVITLVSSLSEFSTLRISQSHSSHARFKLSTFFYCWFQSIIQLINFSLCSLLFSRSFSFSDMKWSLFIVRIVLLNSEFWDIFSFSSNTRFHMLLFECSSLQASISTRVQDYACVITSYDIFLVINDSVLMSQTKLQLCFRRDCVQVEFHNWFAWSKLITFQHTKNDDWWDLVRVI